MVFLVLLNNCDTKDSEEISFTHLSICKFKALQTGSIANDLGYSQSISWGDFNNDSYPDIYVANCWINDKNLFYMNLGNGSFDKIINGIIANDFGNSKSASWGDYENDGFLDLFVANTDKQPNFLYKNTNGQDFQKILSGSIVEDKNNSFGGCWGDYNNDGYIDLFVTNFNNEANALYKNNTNGTFQKSFFDDASNLSLSSFNAAWADLNNDGYLDLFVVNDGPNILYKNLNGQEFEKIDNSILSIDAKATYGCSFADYNNDGYLDIFVTNWSAKNVLYTNQGNFNFIRNKDFDKLTKIDNSEGSSWGDFNNDGFTDLLVSNDGCNCLYINYKGALFINNFTSVLTIESKNSNGVAWTDFDNDGDLDVFIANGGNQKNSFYINQGNNYHWIKIKLIGTISNYSAIGAKINIKYGENDMQYQEVSAQTGGGCGAQKELTLHFGLGIYNSIDTIKINWPSGRESNYFNVKSDSLYVFIE